MWSNFIDFRTVEIRRIKMSPKEFKFHEIFKMQWFNWFNAKLNSMITRLLYIRWPNVNRISPNKTKVILILINSFNILINLKIRLNVTDKLLIHFDIKLSEISLIIKINPFHKNSTKNHNDSLWFLVSLSMKLTI